MTKIHVTHNDILHGKPGDSTHNPVALAMRRAFPRCHDLCIHLGMQSYAIISHQPKRYRCIALPDWVVERIQKHERNGNMEPFTFEVQI